VEGEKRGENDDVFSSGTSVAHVSDFNKSSEVSASTMTTSSSGYGYNKESVFSEIVDPKAR
jgi:hypothetical protein